MGTDVADLVERPSSLYSFKVHSCMCTELMILAYRIEKIFPDIEAARPRCQSGIQALCSLENAIERAKEHLQNCCDSSKLYLAITGDVIRSRLQKSRDLFVKNLDQLQTMVPVMLVAEITGIIDDLKGAKLVLDSSEDEAGKAMRELLQLTPASGSVEYFEERALQLAASRLHITSSRAIVVEERSIKNLLDKISSNDPKKKTILIYLLRLLKKYRNLIVAVQPEGSFSLVNSFEVEGAGSEQNEAQTHILTRATPPEEFKCPISMRMMYDPVVIASGQTFERIWIQKWFDEGNDTCFKTKVKLSHCSLTPNATLKDLISRWCEKHGVTIQDPSLEAFQSLDISTTSIASLGSFANNLHLPLDISNVSLGSLDNSYSSDSTQTMVTNGSRLAVIQKASDSPRQNSANMREKDLEFLSGLDELPWELKLKLVEDVKNHLQNDQVHYYSLSSKNFVDPLVKFLRDSLDQNDARAQRTGAKLLLAFVERNRRGGVSDLHEDTFSVLSSFLQSEITYEVLAILEVLSCDPHYGPIIAASGALSSMLKILDSKSKESHEQAIKILQNLSSNHDICSEIVSLEFIPKLVPFIDDKNLATYCIVVLKNLCQSEEAFVSVAETNGCIASIADLLESGSPEDQEHAVGILLSLCSQRVQYCKLVMDESLNIVPSLVHISLNGNNKGKAFALELLRQLRIYVDEQQFCGPDTDAPENVGHQFEEKKPSSKPPGFFKKMFAKRSSLASKRK